MAGAATAREALALGRLPCRVEGVPCDSDIIRTIFVSHTPVVHDNTWFKLSLN